MEEKRSWCSTERGRKSMFESRGGAWHTVVRRTVDAWEVRTEEEA
jgi:hypothetical protein|tara:strand:- start:260 stop:394 length:135 start_codon:yes stop_codon:yes gene_type:complete